MRIITNTVRGIHVKAILDSVERPRMFNGRIHTTPTWVRYVSGSETTGCLWQADSKATVVEKILADSNPLALRSIIPWIVENKMQSETRAEQFLSRFNDLDRDNMHDNEMIAQCQLDHLINLMSAKATEIYNMAPDSIDGTRLFIFKDNSWIILSNPIQECYRADIDAGTDSTGLAEPEFLRLK